MPFGRAGGRHPGVKRCSSSITRLHGIARLPVRRFRVLIRYRKEEEMKLHLFFILIDILILLVYPFIFVASKVRKLFNFKR